jgi:lactate permease
MVGRKECAWDHEKPWWFKVNARVNPLIVVSIIFVFRLGDIRMVWQQIYDPLGNMFLSTLLAAVPVVVMLAGLGFFHLKAHIAAGAGLVAALVIAIVVYGMPSEMAANAAVYGGLIGLLPLGWIVL